MVKDLFVLVMSAAVVVGSVRFLLIPGIGRVGVALKFSAKVRGQMIGYATSIPELTVLVAGAFAGVFKAGLWNIAASNIINCILFLVTVFAFRQQIDLKNRSFVDEIAFGLLSVVIPLLLFVAHIGTNLWAVLGLLGCFVVYKILDKRFNKVGKPAPIPPGSENGTLRGGLLWIVVGIILILAAGRFLGSSAGALVTQLNVPAWAVGWILGLVTSVCELTSFIEIYRIHRAKNPSSGNIKDTQEALDALVASNVANFGLILPIGMLVYLLVS